MTDALHAALYLLPGLGLLLFALALRLASRRAAAHPAAPRWARLYAHVAITLLSLAGSGLLAVGAGLAQVVLGP